MSVAIDPAELQLQMVRRGLSGAGLARAAQLSAATVSAALAGKRVSINTLTAIAKALTTAPELAIVDSLIAQPNGDR